MPALMAALGELLASPAHLKAKTHAARALSEAPSRRTFGDDPAAYRSSLLLVIISIELLPSQRDSASFEDTRLVPFFQEALQLALASLVALHSDSDPLDETFTRPSSDPFAPLEGGEAKTRGGLLVLDALRSAAAGIVSKVKTVPSDGGAQRDGSLISRALERLSGIYSRIGGFDLQAAACTKLRIDLMTALFVDIEI